MDWDGVGTFAMFLATGGVGLGIIALRAYKARLKARIEEARIAADAQRALPEDPRVEDLERQVARLTERIEFNEKLLGQPSSPAE